MKSPASHGAQVVVGKHISLKKRQSRRQMKVVHERRNLLRWILGHVALLHHRLEQRKSIEMRLACKKFTSLEAYLTIAMIAVNLPGSSSVGQFHPDDLACRDIRAHKEPPDVVRALR